MKIFPLCLILIETLASTIVLNKVESIQIRLLSFAYKKAQSSIISLKVNSKQMIEESVNLIEMVLE